MAEGFSPKMTVCGTVFGQHAIPPDRENIACTLLELEENLSTSAGQMEFL
jgi:hypothetical protein